MNSVLLLFCEHNFFISIYCIFSDEIIQCTAMTWLTVFISKARRTMLLNAPGIIRAVLPCLNSSSPKPYPSCCIFVLVRSSIVCTNQVMNELTAFLMVRGLTVLLLIHPSHYYYLYFMSEFV